MPSDADRVSYNERLYLRSYSDTWNPDEDEKLVQLTRGCKTNEKGSIKETPSDTLCKLFQLPTAPEVDMEQFHGNPLNNHYFHALLAEVVKAKMRKTDTTNKIYNWRNYRADQALHPAVKQ